MVSSVHYEQCVAAAHGLPQSDSHRGCWLPLVPLCSGEPGIGEYWAVPFLCLVDELRAALSGNAAQPWTTWQPETEVLDAGNSL